MLFHFKLSLPILFFMAMYFSTKTAIKIFNKKNLVTIPKAMK